VLTSSSQLYIDFIMAFTNTVTKHLGRDALWARALPKLVAGTDLQRVGGKVTFRCSREAHRSLNSIRCQPSRFVSK
jgi:hypothetical protein